MPEYRIVTKIDPAPAVTGAQKVKQELRGIQQAEADVATGAERMTAAQFRAAQRAGNQFANLGRAIRDAARAQMEAEQAARRVENVVDQEAAALRRLNDLLRDARMAHAAGAITSEQYARVQTLVTNGTKAHTVSLGQQRAGFMMAGQQVQDWTQQLSLGVNPLVVLAQQGGQTAYALQMALGEAGTAGRIAAFMSGPWGSIILAATVVLGGLAMKAMATGDAFEEEMEALKKDADETVAHERAKAAFGTTLEGVTDALRRNREVLDQLADSNKTQARQALEAAIAQKMRLVGIRAEIAANLDLARTMLEIQRTRATGPTQAAELAALNLPQRQAALDALQTRLADTDKRIAEATGQITEALSHRMVELGEQGATAIGRITQKYEGRNGLIELARQHATAEEVANGTLRRRIELLKQQQAAEEKLARTREQSNGVATFRSREQAIGIAGRELQGAGFRVGENVQFGGVRADHPGMGNAAHGRFAIDVNSGAGITEANVPDLRARFDSLARIYQSRGYRVLWNGWVYEAGANGPTRRIPAGQHQHQDHMHLEAPGTIVGKPTQASTAAQALREEGQAATEAEQRRDFVQGIVNKAAGRGMPDTRAAAVQNEINASLAEYEKRFNQLPTPDERKEIIGAITQGEARAQAEHFREAYQYPLEALQISLGKVGLAREVQNRVNAESVRLDRELTETEVAMIENSVRMTDVYERQQAVLEDINRPIENYIQQMRALVGLLEQGQISQAQFNARVADLQGPARQALGDLPADQMDPNSGLSYGQLAQTADENARYAQQLADLQTNRQALLDLGLNYDALERAAHQDHISKLNAIDQARRSTQLMAASNTFDSLAQIAEAGFGKQSAIYKAMFIASKAFAIADSIIKIQQAMASAAMSLPFPANLGAIATVAALGASIIANIVAVKATFAKGGYTGDMAKDQVAGQVHGQEFVVNAAATARNRPLLDAINNGATVDRGRRAGNDNLRTRDMASGETRVFQFGDVIVQAGNATGRDAEEIGQATKRAISSLIDEKLAEESRPGGRLTRTRPTMLSG